MKPRTRTILSSNVDSKQVNRRSKLFVHMLTSLLLALTFTSPATGAQGLSSSNDILGAWVEEGHRKVAVWIEDCHGQLCGRIYWLKIPLSSNGVPKRDWKNPDAGLRNRPLCGMTIMSGFRQERGNIWSAGQNYNPGNGLTFSGTLSLETNGVLKLRGFVGLSLFGKTVTWVRPQENIKACA